MAIELRFPVFPGPHTLFPCRKKFLKLTVVAALFTAFGAFLMVKASMPIGIFVTAFSGIGTVIGVVTLLPGSSSLRLEETGF